MNVTIPKLGLTMEAGVLVRWLVREGETVQKDQAIAELETDKITAEIASPMTGVITNLVPAGPDELPVGTVIAHVAQTP